VPSLNRSRVVGAVAALLVACGVASCSDPAGPNGKFCDAVKTIQATFDPLSKPELYSDPKVLREGLDLRVKAYKELAAVAPKEEMGDAQIVADAFAKISEKLRAAGDVASAANNPDIAAIVNDKAVQQADANLSRFSTSACRDGAAPATATTKKP
jgi:hypothetical protein